jgi:hypothetical protein
MTRRKASTAAPMDPPNYGDVEHLNKYGYWPGKRVPKWAEQRAQELECDPTTSAVLMYAAKYEIDRLRAEYKRLKEDASPKKTRFVNEKDECLKIILDCNRGYQCCHRCPVLSCCDNTSENAMIVQGHKKDGQK